jgi:hypothetical protein
MLSLDDHTPFAACSLAAMDRDDRMRLVTIVAGRFLLPTPGATMELPCRIAEEQHAAPLLDEYWGAPGASSLRHEGQAAFTRPGTDLYVQGHAWAPGGRKTTRSVVGVRVGPCERGVVAIGERTWRKGVRGLVPSSAVPFESLPLRYERCFGGSPPELSPEVAIRADLNPVGCGLFERANDAIDQPLPCFEDPTALIQSPLDRPCPAGLGPIPRHWQPRRQFSGTYDAAWIEQRAPLWPLDLDERFFCAGAPGLVTRSHLVGGEPVALVGLSPDGPHRFRLPCMPLSATFRFRHRKDPQPMALDAISFEPDEGAFTMFWRASTVIDDDALHHEVTEIRLHGEAGRVAV